MKRLLFAMIAVCFVVMIIGCDESDENFEIEKPLIVDLTPFLNHYTIKYDGTACNEDWSSETWDVTFTDDEKLDGKNSDGKGTYYYLGDGSSTFIKEVKTKSSSNTDIIDFAGSQVIIETVKTNLRANQIYYDRTIIMNFEDNTITGELWFIPDKGCQILLEGNCNNCDEKHNQPEDNGAAFNEIETVE